jgi:hypothetical protein
MYRADPRHTFDIRAREALPRLARAASAGFDRILHYDWLKKKQEIGQACEGSSGGSQLLLVSDSGLHADRPQRGAGGIGKASTARQETSARWLRLRSLNPVV